MNAIPRPMRIAAALAGLAAFIAYLATLAPSVAIGDSGELAAAAYTFGVAHPTGYPLYTMLAGIAARMPLGTVAWRLNVFSALLAAAGVALFALFLWRLLETTGRRTQAADGEDHAAVAGNPATNAETRAGLDRLLAATGGALVLGFSRVYWSAALTADVFALHALLVVLLLFTAAPLFLAPRDETIPPRQWRVFAIVLGLALSHHISTLALLPAFVILFLWRFRGPGMLRHLLRPLPWALAGLLPLAYLPLRAAADPALNHGDPSTAAAFIQHAAGLRVLAWMFTGWDVFLLQLWHFADLLAADFFYVFAATALFGLIVLLRRHRRAAWLLALIFAGSAVWAANYAMLDIDRYFLAAFIAASACTAVALERVLGWFRRSPVVPALVIVACVGGEAAWSALHATEHGNFIAEDYTRNVFASLEPRAVIISSEWQHFVAPSIYLQLVEGRRCDVLVLNARQFRRPWYLRQLLRRHPSLLGGAAADAEAYMEAYERDPRPGVGELDTLQRRLAAALAASAARERPMYATIGTGEALFAAMDVTVSGLALRLRNASDVMADAATAAPGKGSMPYVHYRPAPRSDDAVNSVIDRYFRAYARNGNRLWKEGRREEADRCFAKASMFPQFRPGERWKAWQALAPQLSAIY